MRVVLVLIASLLLWPAAARAEQSFEFAAFEIPDSGRIVLPVTEGARLDGIAAELDERIGGALALAVREAAFVGEAGTTLTLYGVAPYARIDLIGVGRAPVSRNMAEDFGGHAAALIGDTLGGSVQILWPDALGAPGATAARVAFGYQLRSYRFDRYQAGRIERAALPAVRVLSNDGSGARFDSDLRHVADSVFLARDLSSEPGNLVYPEVFVERMREQFRGLDDVRIRVLDEKDLQRLNMGAHWGVGKGSNRPPRLLIIEYTGGVDGAAPIVLAGKGITFDTGGISLKDNDGMWMMKGDLGGAAVVSATVYAAAMRRAPVNVVAIAALAENMPSGTASRPGDVLTTMSGLTVEIRSTDAEGRLVLADAVHYAQANYAPSILIDVATLTGSVGRALGDEYAGVFGRHDALIEELSAASRAANEAVWRLPLDDSHFAQLESRYADIVNSGVGSPGASVGAAFIGWFVDPDQPWIHLDIAGVDFYEEERPTVPAGYSGWGVRTLDEYLRRLESSERSAGD